MVHNVKGDNVTVLKDLVEIDSLILDLEDRDYFVNWSQYGGQQRAGL